MCTSLKYQDATGAFYFGRTLELSMELPYQLVYLPAGQEFRSQVEGYSPLTYQTRYRQFAVMVPEVAPGEAAGLKDLKVLEGLNEAGLTFSLLAYPSAAGPQKAVAMTRAVLSASDLGSWILGLFKSVAEVRAALAQQPLHLVKLAMLGGAESPFHYVVHDRFGGSIVIEFTNGERRIHDNPVGVMTNGPDFSWHLTNLNNYSFLSNLDRSTTTFGTLSVAQPDSGIATAGLPSSNTSVGRFVRAVYYAHFAEKVEDPDEAVLLLAHIMNNFDRPRGISVADRGPGQGGLDLEAMAPGGSAPVSEYTSWTSLADLQRGRFYIRSYRSLNYSSFELGALAESEQLRVLPLTALDGLAGDATGTLLSGGNAAFAEATKRRVRAGSSQPSTEPCTAGDIAPAIST